MGGDPAQTLMSLQGSLLEEGLLPDSEDHPELVSAQEAEAAPQDKGLEAVEAVPQSSAESTLDQVKTET